MNTQPAKPCFAYIRISDVKQREGASIDAQREAITLYAERKNFLITKWFEENETAAKSGRAIFNAMMRELQTGNAEGLLIHKIDRSSRNYADWAKIHELSDHGVDIHFVTEDLDFRTRGGQLSADIQAVFAADYIRNLRQEISKGMNARLKQGLYPWKAPVGYLDNGKGREKTICPIMGPKIQKVFELYASGEHTMVSITKEAGLIGLRTSRGGKVTKSGMMRILSNPFYCGLIHIKKRNETYQGNHKPLVSQSLFDHVSEVRGERSVKKHTKHDFLYRGVFTCGNCQTAMVGEQKKSLVYYRCHTPGCPTKTVREDVLESEIQINLRTYKLSNDAKLKAQDWASQRMLETAEHCPSKVLKMQLANIQRKQAALTDAMLEGLIGKTEYQDRKRQLLEQATQLQSQSENWSGKQNQHQKYTQILAMLENLAITYSFALPGEKRQILRNLFSECMVVGKSPYFKPRMWRTAFFEASGLNCAPDGVSSRSYTQMQELADQMLVHAIDCQEVQSILGIYCNIRDRVDTAKGAELM